MKKVFYSALVIILVSSLYLVLRNKAVEVDTAQVKRGLFVEVLKSEGRIESQKRQTLFAFATGQIANLSVKLGDRVSKRQILTVLDWDQKLNVQSPMDGVVSKVYRDSAGPINRGEPIVEVSSLADMRVVVDLLTPDAVKLKIGTEAKIANWGGSENLSAKVDHISKAASVKLSALGVEEERTEVRLALEADEIPFVGDKFHVDVEFLIYQQPDSLLVPLGALFKLNDSWAVFVVNEGRAQVRTVEIAQKNQKEALAVSGISEGEQVILFPDDQIASGVLVKARSVAK